MKIIVLKNKSVLNKTKIVKKQKSVKKAINPWNVFLDTVKQRLMQLPFKEGMSAQQNIQHVSLNICLSPVTFVQV